MMSPYLLKVLLFLVCVQGALSVAEASISEKDELFFKRLYVDMDKGIKDVTWQQIKSALRVFIEVGQELNVSSSCMKNGYRLLTGLRNLDLWVISFLDACGKPGDGFMSGSNQMLGNYDQCLNSTGLKKDGKVDFRGQYCLISYRPYLPNTDKIPRFQDREALILKLTQNLTNIIKFYVLKSEFTKSQDDNYGLCLPSGCGLKDVTKIIQYVGKKTLMNLTIHYCHTEENLTKLTPRRIGITCFFAFFIVLAITGSFLEYYFKRYRVKNENSAIKILICFSLTSNFQKFIKTEVIEANLSCLYGIRVLTLFYVIIGHLYVSIGIIYAPTNFFNFWGAVPQFFFQIIANAYLCVDVFLFIGGFLNCYIMMKLNIRSTSFLSLFMRIMHRLFRIIPAYAASILLFMLLIPRGPMSYKANEFIEACSTVWWKNLLFIDNFDHEKVKCMPHSWYLANDMQFFLTSLITIPLLKRRPKIGVAVNLTIIIFSVVFTTVWIWINQLPPTYVLTNITEKELWEMYLAYILPCTHAAPYFAGVLLGYYLAEKRNIKLSKTTQIFGWFAASTMFLLLLFISKRWNSGIRYSQLESALYFAFSKPLYAMSVGWLIFCCITGHGGIINYILSLKLWIPLGRLSLTAYLLSFNLQLFYLGNVRTTTDVQRMRMIWTYFGDLAVTYLLALCVTMLFESPFQAIEKIIFPKRTYSGYNDGASKESEMKNVSNPDKSNTSIDVAPEQDIK